MSALRRTLRAWRWLLLFVPVSLVLDAVIPEQLPLGLAHELLAPAESWATSPGTRLATSNDALQVLRGDVMPALAARLVAPSPAAEFLALRACLAKSTFDHPRDSDSVNSPNKPSAEDAVALMLASVTPDGLDFNRHNRLYALSTARAGDCVEERMPRMAGDGLAVLQIQFLQPVTGVILQALTMAELQENPRWRALRRTMLGAGLILVGVLFLPYLRPGGSFLRRLLGIAGLGTVAGILFGCCVSVTLKAQIYALLTGGRSIPVDGGAAGLAAVDLEALLLTPFPIDGFYLFTYMHALLFGLATLLLGLVDRRAIADLILLAFVTETLQIFVPGRGPGLSDTLVDLSGVALACGLVVLLRRSERVRLFLQQ